MQTETKILVMAGMATLGYASLLGVALGAIRSKAPKAPHYLVVAHTGSIMTGATLLGLGFASTITDLPSAWGTWAAWLAVGGTAAIALGDTLNWLRKVGDGFAERSAGWVMTASGAPVFTTGLTILLIGVARGV